MLYIPFIYKLQINSQISQKSTSNRYNDSKIFIAKSEAVCIWIGKWNKSEQNWHCVCADEYNSFLNRNFW